MICVYLTYRGNYLEAKYLRREMTSDESLVSGLNIELSLMYCLAGGFLSALVSVIRTSVKGVRVRYTAIVGGLFPILYLFEYNAIARALRLPLHLW
jgi:hypothetical protein